MGTDVSMAKGKKREFSKLILLVYGLIEFMIVAFTCYMVFITCDLTPLEYLIPSTAIVGAVGVRHYYSKAAMENKIKLMKKYGVEPSEDAFSVNEY